MQLIPQPLQNAAEINRINRDMVSYMRCQLAASYALVMSDPQETLDAMGTEAKDAITRYATMHAALLSLGEAEGIATPDYQMFQPQDNGTVIYVAPPPPPATDDEIPPIDPEITP